MPYDDVTSHLSQGHTENSMQAGTLAYKHTSEMFCDYPTGPAEGLTHQPTHPSAPTPTEQSYPVSQYGDSTAPLFRDSQTEKAADVKA